jgi:phosphatidylinositol alpha-1,6-mannosyltransferase
MDHQPQQRDPVQVLYVSRKWPPAIGGMETYSVELCAELPQFVKLTKRVLPGRANGYPPHPISLLRFLLATATFLLLHGGRYDVVHFGDLVLFPLAWLHAMRHRNVRRVVTVHGLDLLYGNRRGAGPAVYRRFLGWARRRSRASVHCYIANSRNTARLATEAGFAPVAPIPLGVRLRSPAPMPAAPRQPAYLLFVGRIVPRKGAAWFASEVLPQLPPPMTLRVAGNPWDPRETDKLKANPRVEVLGFLDAPSLDRERAECLAIVMPNRSSTDQTDVEGFGIAALEAARDGVPIIASAIEGLTDAIIDGKSGFLVAEKDVAAWLHAIQRIQAWTPAQRADYARTAVATVAAHYTWTQVARATVRVYNAGTAPSADER